MFDGTFCHYKINGYVGIEPEDIIDCFQKTRKQNETNRI